jgi:hypothetical protein
MVLLSKPANQERLGAAIHELIRLRFDGPVYIEGEWDAFYILQYLEERMGVHTIPTLNEAGTLFCIRGKFISFTDNCVVVSQSWEDVGP